MEKQEAAVQTLGMNPEQVGTGLDIHGHREDTKDQDSWVLGFAASPQTRALTFLCLYRIQDLEKGRLTLDKYEATSQSCLTS